MLCRKWSPPQRGEVWGVDATREELSEFLGSVLPHLNEMQRRVVAGAVARVLGRGGKSAVAAASGMSRNTVIKAQAGGGGDRAVGAVAGAGGG